MCLIHSKHARLRILPKKTCSTYYPTISTLRRVCRALDLFAGTGSISIELVSRGCDQVISIERDRDHYAFICKVMQELKTDKCLPVRGDVFKYIRGGREQFDFIFADPPYELKGLDTLPDLIFENNLLKEDGLFVLEHGKSNNFESHPLFVERRVYGSVNFSFFKLKVDS